jgi:hypothetical protein
MLPGADNDTSAATATRPSDVMGCIKNGSPTTDRLPAFLKALPGKT